MLIDTAVFGPMDVEDENIFCVPEGLYGFDGIHSYALISKQDDDVTLRWFQAVDTVNPCFVVFNPEEFIDGFRPELEPGDLKALDCEKPEDLTYFVIAVVPDDVTQTTVNLKSPIVVNRQKRTARQVILANKDYPIKFPLAAD